MDNGEKVHVTSLLAERDNLRDQLRQAEGSRRKLIEHMDKLDDMVGENDC